MNLGGTFNYDLCNSIIGEMANSITERIMGISPGRGDFYNKALPDNWIKLPIGACNKEFWIVAEVNPDQEIKENDYSNNCVAIPYQLKYNVEENTELIENIHKSYCINDNSISLSVQKNHEVFSLEHGYLVNDNGLATSSAYENNEPIYNYFWSTNETGESITITLNDLDEDANGQKVSTTFSVDVRNGNTLFPELENYCNVSVTNQVTVSPHDFSETSQGLAGSIFDVGNNIYSGTHYINGNIIVNDGNVVTISDAIVHFDEDAGIIVKPGGRLNIERSVLKNFPCNDLPWNGIFVDGNIDFSHPTNILPPPADYISLAAAHGTLTITDSEVRNARIGISNLDDVKNNTKGGIIIANNTQFINNQKSLALTSPISGHNATSVYNCNFYNMEEFFPNDTYSYPEHNYDPTNKEYRQIELKNARNVSIQKCQFKSNNNDIIGELNNTNMQIHFQVTGIHSNLSSFIIGDANTENQNYFKNLYKGIDIYDNYSLTGDKIIQNNLFNQIRKGITLNNGVLFEVSNNKIYNIPSGAPDLRQSYGIYSFETFGTNLNNNIIHKPQGISYSFGLILEDSKSINANPTDFTVVNSNRFMGRFEAATVFVGENNKVDFDCNQYLPYSSDPNDEGYIGNTDWALLKNDQGGFELNPQGSCNIDFPDPFKNNWHDYDDPSKKHIVNWSNDNDDLTINLNYRTDDSKPLKVGNNIMNNGLGCNLPGAECVLEWEERPPPPPPPGCPIHLRTLQKQVNDGMFEQVKDELLCVQQDWAYGILAGTTIAAHDWITAQTVVDYISIENERSIAMKQYFQTLIDGEQESAGKSDFRISELLNISKAPKKTVARSLAQSSLAILKGKAFNRLIKRPEGDKQETILENKYQTLNIFPNPSSSPMINIDLKEYNIDSESTLVIKSITGGFVKNIHLNNDVKQYEIDVSNMQNGLYLVFLEDINKNVLASGKIVISK